MTGPISQVTDLLIFHQKTICRRTRPVERSLFFWGNMKKRKKKQWSNMLNLFLHIIFPQIKKKQQQKARKLQLY